MYFIRGQWMHLMLTFGADLRGSLISTDSSQGQGVQEMENRPPSFHSSWSLCPASGTKVHYIHVMVLWLILNTCRQKWLLQWNNYSIEGVGRWKGGEMLAHGLFKFRSLWQILRVLLSCSVLEEPITKEPGILLGNGIGEGSPPQMCPGRPGGESADKHLFSMHE